MSQPSVSRHHADWLSLVEVSGPFVSFPVLTRTFPQGLEPRDPAQAKALRATYEERHDNPAAPGNQRAWVMYVLTEVLGYPPEQIVEGQTLPAGLEAKMPVMGETLRPDFALVDTAGGDTAGHAQLLIASYLAEQALDKPVIGKHWKATPATRMMELLHAVDVPLGLITNGEQWMLVYAPRGETTGYASWYGALWLDEPITLRAFHSLLGVRRLFGVAADDTLLGLLKASSSDQQEVTDQLGYQVREAVELLVQSFDALDQESNRTLLTGVSPTDLYDAALTIMMRLVFLFSAEERGLLHLGKPLYDNNYAVSTLQEQLQEVADRHGEEVLERRWDAWTRLLATFRAVHGGVGHQDLLMQAYGGSLFDPDRYPFLEGRSAGSNWYSATAEPLAVNNRVALHLLNALQRLRTKTGASGTTETRRVSFRALGVEQIGHVYEGLLDHTAFRATEPVLGIRGTRTKEPEIPLTTLETLLAQGEDELIKFLKERTGRSVAALRRELAEDSLLDEHKLLIACDQDTALLARLRPFAGLIREDSFERPLIVLSGSVYVTVGTTRRSTGTHYTPPSLTEPIVQHTLEPLVYNGPAEGWQRDQWKLNSPKQILDLKVCDMAMGSGAFLVQACRYLAERLVEAWENEEKQHPGEVLITPDGEFSEGDPGERLVPADANERIAIARRLVADRSLYGVDINPMAVEMAKLSLWLITVDATRPFTFLDHAFKCGDSLLGSSSLEQLANFSLRPNAGKQHTFATMNLRRSVEDAKKKRETLEVMPSDTPDQIAAKAVLYAEAEQMIAKVKALADCLIAFELRGLNSNSYEDQRAIAADLANVAIQKSLPEFQTYAREQVRERRLFHWHLEFPEVFAYSGFSAIIGNPPFLGRRNLRVGLGDEYRDGLSALWPEVPQSSDLCAFFFLRAFVSLLSIGGNLGLLACNTIAQGATRQASLGRITESGGDIYSAWSSMKWPGAANVFISVVHATKGQFKGIKSLDGRSVAHITTFLDSAGTSATPYPLEENKRQSFQGLIPLGDGFVVSQEIADTLLQSSPRNKDVVFPFYNGRTLYRTSDLTSREWIIHFGERSIEECQTYADVFAVLKQQLYAERQSQKETWARVNWWRFWRSRPDLQKATEHLNLILVTAFTSRTFAFAYLPKSAICSNALVVVASEDFGHFACLQSSIHYVWSIKYGSTMKEDLRYTPTSCFQTFPFPEDLASIRSSGEVFYASRSNVMHSRIEGLTDTYNRFHDPCEKSDDIALMRTLQIKMDQAVAAAYGWADLDLSHDFQSTKQGVRYSISETARGEVLDRLLALNHQRHAEEEAEWAAQPAVTLVKKRGRKKKDVGDQVSMDL